MDTFSPLSAGGLCDAVTMTDPSKPSAAVKKYTIGVVQCPRSETSAPASTSPATSARFTASLVSRKSRPTSQRLPGTTRGRARPTR